MDMKDEEWMVVEEKKGRFKKFQVLVWLQVLYMKLFCKFEPYSSHGNF